VLQQSPILMDMDEDEKKYPLVLAKNVKEFSIEWWGTNRLNQAEWSTEWDDNQTNSIPAMLRVHLVLGPGSENNSSAADFAATRIYTVPSQMMPAAVQRGFNTLPLGGPPVNTRPTAGPAGPGSSGGMQIPSGGQPR